MIARRILAVCWLAIGIAPWAAADEAVDHFEKQVRPLLAAKCWQCHGTEKQEASLRLDSPAGIATGGDSGPVVVPGSPEQSPMIQAIGYTTDIKMPPDGKLSAGEIAVLTSWVKSGAAWPKYPAEPSDEDRASTIARRLQAPPTGDDDPLWAFRPMRHAEPPAMIPDGPRGEIDRFLLASMQAQGLSPVPAADKRTLIRRATFDLVGLPPSVKEVDDFLADNSADAYARLIDRLLASPHYGERYARHWLDVARYADSGGYETDMYFRNAWRYRDFVVKSFNDDKPYDRFVQEQIAADEIWPDDLSLGGSYVMPKEKLAHLEARVGTGLYALGPQIHESNMDGKKLDYERLTDWADTTGSVFLGLTLGCARCHDHKFDPISQRDYFSLQAIFAASQEVELPLVNGMEIADFKQHYPRIVAVDEARRAYRLFEKKTAGRKLTPEEEKERHELRYKIADAVLALPEAAASTPNDKFDGLMEIPTATVLGHVQSELIPAVQVLSRGDLDRPKRAVQGDLPLALREATNYREQLAAPRAARKQLATWLTDGEHPLTARVMVNRLWQWHFGAGLVATPNDFGLMGARPTHPELLDWLARKFVETGWSVKQMHRLIMLSDAYQRTSSAVSAGNAARDPDNRYLWRMNRRRLEAEALWDFVHATAGTLNLKQGGRPVIPPLAQDEMSALREPWQWAVTADPQEHTRRGLYLIVRRNFRFPMFEVFDAPVNSVSSARRDVTIVAPQALWSLNNHRAFRQAQQFAARMVRESGADLPACVDRAWLTALSRPPTENERTEALQMIGELTATSSSEAVPPADVPAELARLPAAQAAALAKFCLAIFNLNEFVFVD